ncbi:hypothetical protein Pcinc_012346 [Petrolisthes cinctipes]|uniref:Protein kinase domain-containing protein n=1 Tax=Petrolisthes cinctipes TaxID=88211 RepID=A0AAE1G0U0_PETCI|nr:hypothetical protein Pcinc_012346 [Petrolisthes cinctipes]
MITREGSQLQREAALMCRKVGVKVMTLCKLKRETLQNVVETAREVTQSWLYDVALQLMERYQTMVSLGIRHNDLKSNNICVTTTHCGSPYVTVIDFGMCTD